jgi:hypothetical protein
MDFRRVSNRKIAVDLCGAHPDEMLSIYLKVSHPP